MKGWINGVLLVISHDICLLPSNQGEEAEGNPNNEFPILATLAHNRTRNVKACCFSTNFKIVGPLKKPSEATFHPGVLFCLASCCGL